MAGFSSSDSCCQVALLVICPSFCAFSNLSCFEIRLLQAHSDQLKVLVLDLDPGCTDWAPLGGLPLLDPTLGPVLRVLVCTAGLPPVLRVGVLAHLMPLFVAWGQPKQLKSLRNVVRPNKTILPHTLHNQKKVQTFRNWTRNR